MRSLSFTRVRCSLGKFVLYTIFISLTGSQVFTADGLTQAEKERISKAVCNAVKVANATEKKVTRSSRAEREDGHSGFHGGTHHTDIVPPVGGLDTADLDEIRRCVCEIKRCVKIIKECEIPKIKFTICDKVSKSQHSLGFTVCDKVSKAQHSLGFTICDKVNGAKNSLAFTVCDKVSKAQHSLTFTICDKVTRAQHSLAFTICDKASTICTKIDCLHEGLEKLLIGLFGPLLPPTECFPNLPGLPPGLPVPPLGGLVGGQESICSKIEALPEVICELIEDKLDVDTNDPCWQSLIDAIEDCHHEETLQPPKTVGDAQALQACGLAEILKRLGCFVCDDGGYDSDCWDCDDDYLCDCECNCDCDCGCDSTRGICKCDDSCDCECQCSCESNCNDCDDSYDSGDWDDCDDCCDADAINPKTVLGCLSQLKKFVGGPGGLFLDEECFEFCDDTCDCACCDHEDDEHDCSSCDCDRVKTLRQDVYKKIGRFMKVTRKHRSGDCVDCDDCVDCSDCDEYPSCQIECTCECPNTIFELLESILEGSCQIICTLEKIRNKLCVVKEKVCIIEEKVCFNKSKICEIDENVGDPDDQGSLLDSCLGVDDIQNLDLSVIALLKTILLELRGFNGGNDSCDC